MWGTEGGPPHRGGATPHTQHTPTREKRKIPTMLATSHRALLRRPLLGSLRLLSAAKSTTVLAALVERSPQLTPDLPDYELEHRERQLALEAKHKVYPAVMTAAEEGPDQQAARQRLEQLIEREGSREGEGDRSGDEHSLDRQLAKRLYLLVRDGAGQWSLPQQEWRGPPETARAGVQRAVETACGASLAVHQMGNAPLAHLPSEDGSSTLFIWRCLYVGGQVDAPGSSDYAWVTRDELLERVDAPLKELAATACGPFE